MEDRLIHFNFKQTHSYHGFDYITFFVHTGDFFLFYRQRTKIELSKIKKKGRTITLVSLCDCSCP